MGDYKYAIIVDICSDYDFKYELSNLGISSSNEDESSLGISSSNEDGRNSVFYYKDRETAVGDLLNEYHSFADSFQQTGHDEIEQWVDLIDLAIDKVTDRYDTFSLERDFGNQQISFRLCEVKITECAKGETISFLPPDIILGDFYKPIKAILKGE